MASENTGKMKPSEKIRSRIREQCHILRRKREGRREEEGLAKTLKKDTKLALGLILIH